MKLKLDGYVIVLALCTFAAALSRDWFFMAMMAIFYLDLGLREIADALRTHAARSTDRETK